MTWKIPDPKKAAEDAKKSKDGGFEVGHKNVQGEDWE